MTPEKGEPVIVEWRGSQFHADRPPRTVACRSIGWVVGVEDIDGDTELTLVSHVRRSRGADKDDKGFLFSSIRYSQIDSIRLLDSRVPPDAHADS
jgi:hypothetical protein